jgi:hypothetical protein
MWFSSAPGRPRTSPTPTPRARRFRPALEPLEERWAPATFTNPAAINLPIPPGPAAPYPSAIEVSGLAGAVSKVTVTLHGFSSTFPDNVDILLVAPNGANATILSDVGGVTEVNGLTLTLDDAAVAPLPDDGPLTSGTFQPTNAFDGNFNDPFPPPAPTASAESALSVFNGINPNGTWSLFAVNDGISISSIGGGWTLNLQGVNFLTATAVSAAPSPARLGQAVTLTATVTGPGTPAGTVTFRDGAAVLGTASLAGGRAVLTVPGLGLGPHAITAAYDGNADLLGSTSAALVLVVNDQTPGGNGQITAAPFRRNGVARVRVREATTGKMRATLTPFRGFGGRLGLQLRDVNGDGVLDLIVKAFVNGRRKQKVYDAVTLAPLPANLA